MRKVGISQDEGPGLFLLKIEEETWERELEMMKKYPGLFSYIGMNLNFDDEFFLGGENVKPLGEKS